MSAMTMDDISRRLHDVQAHTLLNISIFGDELAEREGYAVDGLEAIGFHLFERYGLRPSHVRVLSVEALSHLMNKQMKDWTVPAQHRGTTVAEEGAEKTILQARLAQYLAQAGIDHLTELFGDTLARREGYAVSGRDALELYLCRKLGYSPDEVGSWSYETIRKLLGPEMAEWKPPAGA